MSIKIYEGKYPIFLKTKTEWNKEGRKIAQESSNIYRTDKGTDVELFLFEETTPLNLSDSNAELVQWRNGLKAKELATSEELDLINQLEYQIKRRILESNLDKDYISFETIYFNNEYPIERMGKGVELNRKGLKAKKEVGVYIQGNTFYRLYAVDYSSPLEVHSSTKKEREDWLRGLQSGIINDLEESKRLELISAIEESLGNTVKRKKSKTNSVSEKVKAIVEQMSKERIYLHSFRELNLKLTKLIYEHYLNCYGEKYVNFSEIEEALFCFIAQKNLSKESIETIDIQCQKNRYQPIQLIHNQTDHTEYVTVYYKDIVRAVEVCDDDEWEMRDGTLIRVKDMQTSHIQNTIRMLQRNILADEKMVKESGGRVRINNYSQFEWIEIFNHELKKRNA